MLTFCGGPTAAFRHALRGAKRGFAVTKNDVHGGSITREISCLLNDSAQKVRDVRMQELGGIEIHLFALVYVHMDRGYCPSQIIIQSMRTNSEFGSSLGPHISYVPIAHL